MLNFVDDLEWDKWVLYYTFAYNITPHINNNYSPYQLIFGKLPTLPTDSFCAYEKVYDLEKFSNKLKTRIKRAIDNAKN